MAKRVEVVADVTHLVLRIKKKQLIAVDRWIDQQGAKIEREKAIRKLLKRALKQPDRSLEKMD